MKYMLWMCGIGLILCLLCWICAVSEAQEMPAQSGGTDVQHPQSPTGQAEHAGEKQPYTPKKRQGVPSPERNRFEEMTRNKGGGSGHRRSGRKNSSQGTRPTSGVSDEQSVAPVIRKKGKKKKRTSKDALHVKNLSGHRYD